MRAVMPFHFLFGAIMGYYYGLFLETGNKSDHVKALLIPILIHGLFDFSIKCIEINDYYIIFTLAVMVLTFALAVYVIYKIHKWSKDGTLSKPIPALNSEEAGV
jgi:RsiW-degrading membrane proteinase PrsW (M82 family)